MFGLCAGVAMGCGCAQSPPAMAASEVPACRVDAKGQRIAGRAASVVLTAYHAEHPAAPPTRLILGEDSTDADVAVTVLSDAPAGSVDAHGCLVVGGAKASYRLDSISVQGVCTASDRAVRCAAGAVEALQGDADEPSPALLFVMSHELGHVILRHTGHFIERTTAIDLALPRQEKASLFADLCSRDVEQMQREIEADAFAQAIVSRAFVQPPYFEPAMGPAGSVVMRANQVAQGAISLDDWNVSRLGGVPSPPLRLATHPVCSLLSATSGIVRLQTVRGTHPRGAKRISDLTHRLATVASRLSSSSSASPTSPGASLGNLPDLGAAMGPISAAIEQDEATRDDDDANAFCKDAYAAEASSLSCW